MTMRSGSSAAAPAGTLSAFQRLCLVAGAVIFGLIVLGGVVRATDSGLGCPDWPRCHGSFIPQWEKHTLIEYSHRLTASVAGLLVLAVAVAAWRAYRRVPAVLYPATLAFALLILQAGLGGLAVVNELPPEIVTVHLGLALAILTLIGLTLLASVNLSRPIPRPAVLPQGKDAFGRLALLASGATLALMLVGAYVAGAGYGLACSGWPLCNDEVVPSAGAASVQVHFAHRLLALALGLVLLVLAWRGWRERARAPFEAAVAGLALGLYVLQALVGAANIWTRLADEASAAHLALGTLLWLVLAFLNGHVHRLYELRALSGQAAARPGPSAGPGQGLAGAPR